MKFASVLALSIGIMLAPGAHAQITCQQVQNLMEAATEDFDSIAGEVISDDVYGATFKLNGAEDCQITFDLSSTYACIWVYDSLASARADYGLQSGALGACLDEWDREPFTPAQDNAALKQLDAVSFYQMDEDDAELTWVAYLEEHIEGDTHDWHVWVGIDYF